MGPEDPLEKGQSTHCSVLGLPLCSAGRESVCNAEDMGSIPGWEDPLEKGNIMVLTPVFWPEEFHRLYSPWSHKKSDTH